MPPGQPWSRKESPPGLSTGYSPSSGGRRSASVRDLYERLAVSQGLVYTTIAKAVDVCSSAAAGAPCRFDAAHSRHLL